MVGARGPDGWSQPALVCHCLQSRPHGFLFRVGAGAPGTPVRTGEGGCCPAVPVLVNAARGPDRFVDQEGPTTVTKGLHMS
ncbi:hypothetical protein GCM10010278_82780 [Streptomyces melanogenes]|nr:hypothetical protein GCM10010278_82780 [Streptomyces melanogenes]